MKTIKKFFFAMSVLSLLAITGCDNTDEPTDDLTPEQNNKFPTPTEKMAVDLGLSVKWAPYNVGASAPEDYGNYYAWGEIEPKNVYSSSSYKLDYVPDVTSGTEYDVAHIKWGLKWRIPTLDETYELVKNCKWEETKIAGVTGMKVTGPSGNSIFLPAAGRYVGDTIQDCGSFGHYWQGGLSSSLGEDIDEEQMYYYDLNYVIWGLSIRPVWGD